MKKHVFIVFFSAICLHSSAQLHKGNINLGYNQDAKKFEDSQVKQFNHLKLYYIKAKPSLEKEVKDIGDYTNLETALKKKMITIKEVSKNGNVNSLVFHNMSKTKTIMVQLGDVVQGGKQDRVVENDALIKPGEKVELSVYCVEHGRWSGSSRGSSAPTFSTYHSSINSDIKKTIVKDKNQSKVWSKVAEKNTLNFTETNTGTYTAINSNKNYSKETEQYMNNFISEISKDKEIIGVLAVTGNRIIGCEIYATPKLLQANIRNILNSFISEAVINGSEVSMDDTVVNDYLSNLIDSEEKQDEIIKENGKSLKFNGKKVKLSSF